MYRVIKRFTDLQDGNFRYNVGDTYPRKGFEVLQSRIKELSGKNNRRGEALIVEVPEVNEEKKKKKSAAEKE